MAGIGIITNPHSKFNKKYPHRQQLLGYIAGEQGQVAITNDLDELYKVAQEFARKNIKILAINGGDGTISRTLTAFLQVYGEKPLPNIVLLRGGTMNMLADNLGIQGSPEHLLFRLMEAHATDSHAKTVRIPMLKIGNQFGFLFANGTSARYLKEFYKNKTGSWGAIWLVIRLCLGYLLQRPFYFSLVRQEPSEFSYDETPPFSHGSASIFCSTVTKLPLKMPFFHQLPTHPGKFECVSLQLSPNEVFWKLGPILWFILRNQPNPKPYWVDFCAKRLTLSVPTPALYTLDGELYTSQTPITVEMGPTIEFLLPT
jgi:diacylglycerol kinase (ATP)